MEAKSRGSVETLKKFRKELRSRFVVAQAWGLTILSVALAIIVAPSWRGIAAVALVVAAYHVLRNRLWTVEGPCAGFVGGALVARSLFIIDSKARTRAWLGMDNQYGDEEGPRLVFYDWAGQAKLALRLVRETSEQIPENIHDRHAEVVQREKDGEEELNHNEPALVMFNKKGIINISLWSNGSYPSLSLRGAMGDGGIQPNSVWVLNGKTREMKTFEA